MNISFNLDSTIIPNGKEFNTEKRSLITKYFGIEELRKGSKNLIKDLKNQGHTIHIYTTSYRSKFRIRTTLKYYGIKVNHIVNQTENQKVLRSKNIHASKYPPAFNFDIHIDDLIGVGSEGEKHIFKTIIVHPNDTNWSETIKTSINQFSSDTF